MRKQLEIDSMYEVIVPVPNELKNFKSASVRMGVESEADQEVCILVAKCPKCNDIRVACRKHINDFKPGCLICQTVDRIETEFSKEEAGKARN